MKRILVLAALPLCLLAKTVTYDVTMKLRVPVVTGNSKSLGKRVYRTQTVQGVMKVETGEWEPEVSFPKLENRSHRVGGAYVTYGVDVERVGWHAIGDNRKGVFRKPSVTLSIEAMPNYALAGGEDNTLILTLAGGGTTERGISGYASGQLGCGCYAYGHVSPTRIMWDPCAVVDTAAVWGTWTAVKRGEER